MPAKAKQSKVAARKAVRTQLAQAASNNNKVQQSKANAAQTAQPGVIGSIIALLVDAKPRARITRSRTCSSSLAHSTLARRYGRVGHYLARAAEPVTGRERCNDQ
jgi:hypothetical protein